MIWFPLLMAVHQVDGTGGPVDIWKYRTISLMMVKSYTLFI